MVGRQPLVGEEGRGPNHHSLAQAFDKRTARKGTNLYLKLFLVPQPVGDTQDIQDKRKLGSNKPRLDKNNNLAFGHGVSF